MPPKNRPVIGPIKIKEKDNQVHIDSKGTLRLNDGVLVTQDGVTFGDKSYELRMDDMEINGELGRGQYGVVYKVFHRKLQKALALKEIQLTTDDTTPNQISMELNILWRNNSPYIVKFYGSFFLETKVYYGMEYMDGGSLDKLYDGGVPEPIIAKIAFAMVSGLKYMKDDLQIIHRDVKPTNVVVNSLGEIKLCDFGVSGQLVQSLAKTYVGCQHYMAPERIAVSSSTDKYGVYSDVWSLGVSLLEVAIGAFPYGVFDSVFSQLNAIVTGETPTLPADRFSQEAIDFCLACMLKDYTKRPTYAQLLEHPFLKKFSKINVDVISWVHDGMMRYQAKKNGTPPGELSPASKTEYIVDLVVNDDVTPSVRSESGSDIATSMSSLTMSDVPLSSAGNLQSAANNTTLTPPPPFVGSGLRSNSDYSSSNSSRSAPASSSPQPQQAEQNKQPLPSTPREERVGVLESCLPV